MKELKHIAFICDGNGRWAQKRGLKRTRGHARGAEVVKETVENLKANTTVKTATFYIFSTENWKRPKQEIDFIMGALEKYLRKWLSSFQKQQIKVSFIGNRQTLLKKTLKTIEKYERLTRDFSEFHLVIAFNYGGREEIVQAAQQLLEKGVQTISEESLADHLYTNGLSEIDFVIRTSGEKRLSNFLLWQSAYSEFYFTDVYWPDFDENQLNLAIDDYFSRERRFGDVGGEK